MWFLESFPPILRRLPGRCVGAFSVRAVVSRAIDGHRVHAFRPFLCTGKEICHQQESNEQEGEIGENFIAGHANTPARPCALKRPPPQDTPA